MNGLLPVVSAFLNVPLVVIGICSLTKMCSLTRMCSLAYVLSGLVQPKLSKEEQKKLLEERLAKNRENKAKQDKELE